MWDDGVLRVTVESLKKAGKTLTMNILYENISDKAIKVYYNYQEAHLLDEDGGRWNYTNNTDTAEVWQGRDLLSGKKIRSKMQFEAKDSDIGKIFDLFLENKYNSYYHQYMLTIENIKAN